MAKLQIVLKAQKNIYARGKNVQYVSKKGKRTGETLTKLDRTIPFDENDKVLIAIGEPYFWWQHQNSPKQYSRERPRRSQLTRSAFLGWLYDMQDTLGELSAETMEDLSSRMEDIKSELEEWRDTCQENRDNMPEALQDSDTGTLLQERIDMLESAISELDNMEYDCEKDEDTWKEEWKEENEVGEFENEQAQEDAMQVAWQEYEQEQVNSKIEDIISNVSLDS